MTLSVLPQMQNSIAVGDILFAEVSIKSSKLVVLSTRPPIIPLTNGSTYEFDVERLWYATSTPISEEINFGKLNLFVGIDEELAETYVTQGVTVPFSQGSIGGITLIYKSPSLTSIVKVKE